MSTPEPITNEQRISSVGRLGKLPDRSSKKALLFADFVKAAASDPPKAYNPRRAKLPSRLFGNDQYGCCTIAAQAIGAVRMERQETKHTPVISDNSVLTAYFNMTDRLYGGGDTGAYSTDALDNWRNPEWTFKDADGNPLTIDAYTRVNHYDQIELRRAIYTSPGHGLQFGLSLPWAWQRTAVDGGIWDAPPAGQQPIGEWMPGSWGGHETHAIGYTVKGILLYTWGMIITITWPAVALYCDGTHWTLDSLDEWRKRAEGQLKTIKIPDLVDAVNSVSSIQIGK